MFIFFRSAIKTSTSQNTLTRRKTNLNAYLRELLHSYKIFSNFNPSDWMSKLKQTNNPRRICNVQTVTN